MPSTGYSFFNKRGVKRELTLLLDEGDDVLECVQAGMREHSLSEVTVTGIEGTLAEGIINYFLKNEFKSAVLKDKALLSASGSFKLTHEGLFGSMKVIAMGRPPLHGTLVKGKAGNDFTLKLSFVEFLDQ